MIIRGGQSWCLIKHQLLSVWTNQTLSRSVFIKVLLSLSLFYQTRSYPLYQYQLWSSLTSEPPHQSQSIFTLCCKCCFKTNQSTPFMSREIGSDAKRGPHSYRLFDFLSELCFVAWKHLSIVQQSKHFVGKTSNLWKVLRKHKRVWVWQNAAWNLLCVWKKYTGTKGDDLFNWRKQKWKKNVLIFFIIGRKKWKKESVDLFHKKQNCAVLCFCAKKNTNRLKESSFWANFVFFLKVANKHLFDVFLACKNTFFLSEKICMISYRFFRSLL